MVQLVITIFKGSFKTGRRFTYLVHLFDLVVLPVQLGLVDLCTEHLLLHLKGLTCLTFCNFLGQNIQRKKSRE